MDARWHEQRRTGLGGSDMPSVLGICPFGGTPLGVWKAKVGLGSQGEEESPDTRRGKFLEPIIRDLYRQETGYTVTHSDEIIRHPSETWAIAHLDGEIFPGDDENYLPEGPGIFEAKAPRIRGFVALEEYGVPPHYQVQVQHYMAVRGRLWTHFTAWNAEAFRLLIVLIERDQGLIDLMFEEGRNFWTRHVLTGIPPEGKAPTVLRLENLSPTVLRLENPEWQEAARQWGVARKIAAESTEYMQECRENLIAIAAGHGAAKIRGGGVSFTVGKDGKITIRQGKEEITS